MATTCLNFPNQVEADPELTKMQRFKGSGVKQGNLEEDMYKETGTGPWRQLSFIPRRTGAFAFAYLAHN